MNKSRTIIASLGVALVASLSINATMYPHQNEDSPLFNCKTMGNKVCSTHAAIAPPSTDPLTATPFVCWIERNNDMPNGTEQLSGTADKIHSDTFISYC